jgi:hypothetical protein
MAALGMCLAWLHETTERAACVSTRDLILPKQSGVCRDGAAGFCRHRRDGKVRGQCGSSGVTKADFTGMTRQQLFDWMNGQIRSGAMSLDESTPFLGMTLKIDAQTMQPVDMASDTTPIDFMDRAKQGIAGLVARRSG